mmetsp:Transcript_20426/g.31524  ORF Transcript_20426/g.31524 Transcript_20426/m.31524 type:complete len:558 (-) Transcript_20426:122-1795(-)|eukprot:CAMPEP_0195305708 /NCGR_PEP_ID=MMETSP0707-20130614/36798_1 /TAXON_ID=33640 /ORGANISM="Asterionellopsis glacialis, Strain CCMP134" /LENGTH=557 /DNA_ID=CAMNT_0040369903 /DNA_START=71 /DNA_END=1744 /DNA_ORIENTATION=+
MAPTQTKKKTNSLYLDDLVTMRLKSGWGRPTGPAEPPGVMPELHERIAAVKIDDDGPNKWEAVLARCKSHPKEVIRCDRRGRTCLSAACAKDPSVELVEVLLKECHFGTDALRDKHGRTALGTAINSHASLKVIEKLASRGRSVMVSDHGGNAPLHLACMNDYRHGVEDLVRILLEVDPTVAKLENTKGKIPLHLALEAKAPAEVIELLAKVCPETVANDTCGYTPLMMAIQYSASIEVFRCLVQANPSVTLKRDECGRLPLRRALEFRCDKAGIIDLLCTSKESVMETDKIGRNALHLALEWITVNPLIIKTLLKQAPQASHVHSPCTGTPLNMAYQRYARSIRNVEYHGPSASRASVRDMEDWWDVACSILRASTSHRDDDKRAFTKMGEWSILHAALATESPIQVFRTIMKYHVGEVNLPNQDGQYPLMLAATMQKDNKTKEAILNLLLKEDCTRACEQPDKNGRYTLSVVAESNGISTDVLYRIIYGHPDALRIVDPIHKMYPFLVAALPRKESENKADAAAAGVMQTSCIYDLLVAGPDVLSFTVDMESGFL